MLFSEHNRTTAFMSSKHMHTPDRFGIDKASQCSAWSGERLMGFSSSVKAIGD